MRGGESEDSKNLAAFASFNLQLYLLNGHSP